MPRYLALLRGINVAGNTKVGMADLRDIAVQLGHTEVATYIQSGNLLFTSGQADSAALADALEQEITRRLGVRSAVVVLSAADLASVVAANPFPGAADPRFVHAVFRRDELGEDGLAQVAGAAERARAKGSPDEVVAIGRTIFLHTPGGFGRSELAAQLSRTALHAGGTARNWATVTRLSAMMGNPAPGGE